MNLHETTDIQKNVILVKQEPLEVNDISTESLQNELPSVPTIESTSLNTLAVKVTSSQSLEIKLETRAQDQLESDQNMSIKQELLHEELDIKSEDETVQVPRIDNKPFKCNICDFSSDRKANLKTHLISHSGEKPFKCNICGYRFGLKSILKSHLLTHTKEKPFKCNICDYSCGQKGNLTRHLKTHTGEKAFKCEICGYSVGHKSSWKKHLETHTGKMT